MIQQKSLGESGRLKKCHLFDSRDFEASGRTLVPALFGPEAVKGLIPVGWVRAIKGRNGEVWRGLKLEYKKVAWCLT